MNKKSTGLLLSILGVLSLVLITAGVTYAFFNYAKEGSTENSITTGKITFIYEEVEAQGAGISISDAYPISDTEGKDQTGSGKVFNFTVKSQTMNNASIPYVVTARMKVDSTLDQSAVKVYLTEVNGTNETELLLDTYDNLTQTSVDVPEGTVEKVIYTDTVPAGSSSYEKDFRLRMWIPDTIDFSPNSDGTYPYNGKTFTLTVNVYANAKVITDSGTTTSLLKDEIMKNPIIEAEPTLTDSSNNTSDVSGLYKSIATNSGNPTYYFRGNVENNYVSFGPEVKKESCTYNGSPVGYYNPETEYWTDYPTQEECLSTNVCQYESDGEYYYNTGVTADTCAEVGGILLDEKATFAVNYEPLLWRVVRINEDGTIRMIMESGINDNVTYAFNSTYNANTYMYYTNGSNAKTQLESWYQTNIASNTSYSSKVASGNYFCEQAKTAYSSSYASNSGASMTVYSSYTPDFKCSTDENGKGLVNASIGLITYDEVVYAGGYYGLSNSNYYLYNSNISWWTMSPAGFSGSGADVWSVHSTGIIYSFHVYNANRLRAVLILNADTAVTGTGTSDDPWVVQ